MLICFVKWDYFFRGEGAALFVLPPLLKKIFEETLNGNMLNALSIIMYKFLCNSA